LLPDREVYFNLAGIGCLQVERQVLTLPEARVKTFQFVFEMGRLPITRLAALYVLLEPDPFFEFFLSILRDLGVLI
jgi:hypothetical protein